MKRKDGSRRALFGPSLPSAFLPRALPPGAVKRRREGKEEQIRGLIHEGEGSCFWGIFGTVWENIWGGGDGGGGSEGNEGNGLDEKSLSCFPLLEGLWHLWNGARSFLLPYLPSSWTRRVWKALGRGGFSGKRRGEERGGKARMQRMRKEGTKISDLLRTLVLPP